MYLAHISTDKKRQQTLIEHSYAVKAICEEKGQKLSLPTLAGLTGLLHDTGKYSDTFQMYLLNGGVRGSIKHSFVGAQLLDIIMNEISLIENWRDNNALLLFNETISNAILAHHSALKDMRKPDSTSLYLSNKRLTESYVDLDAIYHAFLKDIQQNESLNSFEEAKKWLHAYVSKALMEFLAEVFNKITELLKNPSRIYAYIPFLTKTLYSILIDADRTDTALFMDNQTYQKIDYQVQLEQFRETLESYLAKFKGTSDSLLTEQQIEINRLRQKMSDECQAKGKWATGIYQLPIPTGGGKTFSGIRFALEHAVEHKKDRIIYVVPYTSIVEQNAAVIREALGDSDLVFEHHSNIMHPLFEDNEDQVTYQLKRASNEQTWEMPIIFTTAVQLLNTIFKNKSKDNRRLHNLMNSVIIVDEIQSLPQHTIHLFNEAANFLTYIGKTTVILCTATQPNLDELKHPIEHLSKKADKRSLVNLTETERALFDRATVKFEVDPVGWTTEEIAQHLLDNVHDNESALLILNTKAGVEKLYERLITLKDPTTVYYLTTNLCAIHRQEILEQIREDLKAQKPIICISTSLIEAGVDISFSVVYRALTGLDSIKQAIGRCNRNGELVNKGRVYIFKHAEERTGFDVYTTHRKNSTLNVLKLFNENEILNEPAMQMYFQHALYEISDMVSTPYGKKSLYALLFPKRDRYSLKKDIKELAHFALYDVFDSAFKVIDSETVGILVPYKVSHEELIAMNYSQKQRYSINVYDQTFEKLKEKNALVIHQEGDEEIYLLKAEFYDNKYGLIVK